MQQLVLTEHFNGSQTYVQMFQQHLVQSEQKSISAPEEKLRRETGGKRIKLLSLPWKQASSSKVTTYCAPALTLNNRMEMNGPTVS